MHLGEQEFDQEGPANVIDSYNAMSDAPLLPRCAIARTTDLYANDPPTERVEQRLTIGGIAAQIGDDQTITIVSLINYRQRACQFAAVQPNGQLRKFFNSQ